MNNVGKDDLVYADEYRIHAVDAASETIIASLVADQYFVNEPALVDLDSDGVLEIFILSKTAL